MNWRKWLVGVTRLEHLEFQLKLRQSPALNSLLAEA